MGLSIAEIKWGEWLWLLVCYLRLVSLRVMSFKSLECAELLL